MKRNMILVNLLSLLLLAAVDSLTALAPQEREPVARQLVLENDHARVSRFWLKPKANTEFRSAEDSIIVGLTNGTSLTIPHNQPYPLGPGEVRFLARPSQLTLENLDDKPSISLVVELKRHWDVPMKACSAPSNCTRPVRVGSLQVGETTTLLSNGFVTVMRHRLDRGGTLQSSYYSAKGVDYVIVVPVTDIDASIGAINEHLLRGQPYFSGATEIEVSAAEAPAEWVVIRLHEPK